MDDAPNPHNEEAAKQWGNPSNGLTPQFMYDLFLGGVVGTKELRGWLAAQDPTFAAVRDADVDNEIDRLARERAEAIHNLRAKDDDPPQEETAS
jgi:hypothetical protein